MTHIHIFFFSASLACATAFGQTRLQGTVVDDEGRGLPFANLSIGDAGLPVQADAQGAFVLRGAGDTPFKLRASMIGHVPLDTVIDPALASSVIELRLHAQLLLLRDVEVNALRAGDRSPYAQTIITHDQLQRTNTGVDMPLLLDQVPSAVTTTDAGTGFGYTGIRIRGSDATRINVTVNGVPFNDAESQGAFWVDMPDLATSTEDIEVQRGVGSSTNGPGAFGASINVRTQAVRREPFAQASAFAGSYNTQRYSASAGTGLIGDRFAFDARLSSITSDGYIDRGTADLKSYFLQGAWLGQKRSLRFITFGGHEVTYQAWDGVPREVIDTNRTYNGFTYDNQVDDYTQTHYQLLFDQRLGANATLNITLFRVNGSGFYEQYKEDAELEAYGIDPPPNAEPTSFTSDLITRKWLDNTLTGANASVEMRMNKHRLVIGGSYNEYRCDHFGEVIWVRSNWDHNIRDRFYDDRSKKIDANGYAKLTYAVNDKLDLFGDVQLRNVTYDFLGYDDAFQNVMQEFKGNFFNPKAGLLWRVHEGGRVYGSVAVANREPNRDDLVETTPQSRPRSEHLTDYELGYERRSGRYTAGLNFFYMDYLDQLVLTGELNDVGAALRTNVKSSYRAGVEATWAVRMVDPLTWKANVSLSRNKVRDFTEYVDDWDMGGQQANVIGESDIAFSPNVIAGSELTCRVWNSAKKGHADLSFVSKYVGEQFLDNTSSKDRKLDAYIVHDLRANVSLTGLKGLRSIDFNITVRNLFSELYESNGWVYSYSFEGQRQAMVGLYPQAPLNVLAGVTLRF